jgi:hypothetical protein
MVNNRSIDYFSGMNGEAKRLVGAIVLTTLVGLIFSGSFLGALHRPRPHGVPVAVAAPPQVVAGLAGALDRRAAGAFDLAGYPGEAEARRALLRRDVDGIFIPAENRLVVAGATGRTTSTLLTEVFRGASGGRLTVEDARPLPADDGNGIASMFFVVTVVIPGIALGVAVSVAAPRLRAAGRVSGLAIGAIAIAGAGTLVADAVVGALDGAPWALWGAGALIAFAVAATVAGLLRVAGPAGAALAALVIVPIGVPASGGPVGAGFIPRWYADVGEFLPVSAGINAVRNIVYFDANAIGARLLVLAVWATAGALLTLAPRVWRRHTAPATAPA